jgi:glucose-1-phosphate cytidylyltransferase
MQAVILCGGKGTRIRDVAKDIPKPMIPIGDRPILWHIMKSHASYGIRDFILCLGYKSWAIKQYFLDYHLAHSDITLNLSSRGEREIHDAAATEDWKVTLVETGLESMTGGRVKRIEKYLKDDCFLLTYGDGVSDVNLQELVRFHLQHGRLGTVTAVRPPSRFGELELQGTKVIEFNEKPAVPRGRIAGGFFVFDRRFLERLPTRDDLVLEKGPLAHLARDGELCAYVHDGFWHCMDSSRDYDFLNGLWAEGRAPWASWTQRQLRSCA